jgi:5'-nucleotidase
MRSALLALTCVAAAGSAASASASAASASPASASARAARAHSHHHRPAAGAVAIQLLGVNDLHGNLEPPLETLAHGRARAAGGVAYLAAYLDRARARNPRGTLTLHSGDMVGGSPLISSWFHDEPAIDATNLIGFDAGTIGNHELDEGEGEMLRLIRGGQRSDGRQVKDGRDTSSARFAGADYPYLSANVIDRATGRPLLAPYAVFTRRGVKIGVIGVTTLETVSIVAPDAIAGLRFDDLSAAVNRSVTALHRRGVHAIVVLAHAGGDELRREVAQMSGDVDVVLGGHTHQRMDERVGGRLVLQAGRYGEAFDDVRLTVRRRDGQVVRARAVVVDVRDRTVRPDRRLRRLVASYRSRVAPLAERVVASADRPATRRANAAGETPLGDLVADGQRRLAGAEVALVNSGAIRADLPAGPVTFAQAFAAQPWDDSVVATTLTGADLRTALAQQFDAPGKELLQVSGLTWRRDGTTASDVLVGGEPLDDDRAYRVAVNGALSGGADGFTALARGRDVVRVGSDLDALLGELAARARRAGAPDPEPAPRIAGTG